MCRAKAATIKPLRLFMGSRQLGPFSAHKDKMQRMVRQRKQIKALECADMDRDSSQGGDSAC